MTTDTLARPSLSFHRRIQSKLNRFLEQSRQREFAALPKQSKEQWLRDALLDIRKDYLSLENGESLYQRFLERTLPESSILERIYHDSQIDYSQGRIRTAFNNLARGFLVDGFISIAEAAGAVFEPDKEEPDNFLYKAAKSAEKFLNEAFPDNPDYSLTSAISRGVGQVFSILVPGGVTSQLLRLGNRAKQLQSLQSLLRSAEAAGDVARVADLTKKIDSLKRYISLSENVIRLQAATQIAGLSINEARDLGLSAGLDPRESLQNALAYAPASVALNMVPIEKAFRLYRLATNGDGVAEALVRAGIRDQFMPLFARGAIRNLLRAADVGISEAITESAESFIRNPIVLGQGAPWEEILSDGAIGGAVGLIVGAPAVFSSRKRKVTYEQGLADLDNLLAILDGYSDKLTPLQKEVRDSLRLALQSQVTPEFIEKYLNVEIVDSPSLSDDPKRVGTHGEIAQIAPNITAFLQKAAAASPTPSTAEISAAPEATETPETAETDERSDVSATEKQEITEEQPSQEKAETKIEETQLQQESTPIVPDVPSDRPTSADYATTPDNKMRVDIQFEVVDASDLKFASDDLQPRDRTRKASELQIRNIAQNFTFDLMNPLDRRSDSGLPIVGPDNVIESGNARVAAIRLMASEYPNKYKLYRDFVDKFAKERGIQVPEGIQLPILIRRRVSSLDDQQRIQFVRASNEDNKISFSELEQALLDAKLLDSALLQTFDAEADGGVLSPKNKDFVSGFIDRVSNVSNRNLFFDEDLKFLSKYGKRRIELALLAYAIPDKDFLQKAIESTDEDLKSLLSGISSAAPYLAEIRSLAQSGALPKEYDISNALAKAYALHLAARNAGMYIRDYLATEDFFDPIPAFTKRVAISFTKLLQGKRLLSSRAISVILKRFYDKVQLRPQEGQFFSNLPSVEKLWEEALEGDQLSLFEAPRTEVKASFLKGANEKAQEVIQSPELLGLQNFSQEQVERIASEGVQEALIKQATDEIVAENEIQAEQLGSSLVESTVQEAKDEVLEQTEKLIAQEKGVEFESSSRESLAVVLQREKERILEEEKRSQLEDVAQKKISRWLNKNAKEILGAEFVEDIISTSGFVRLFNSLKSSFTDQEELARYILNNRKIILRGAIKNSFQLSEKNPAELQELIRKAISNRAKFSEISEIVRAIAVKALTNLERKSFSGENPFQREDIYSSITNEKNGLFIKDDVAQLLVDGRVVAAAVVRNNAVVYLGRESEEEYISQFLSELERRTISVFYPQNDKISPHELDYLVLYVFSDDLYVPYLSELAAFPNVTARFGLTQEDTERDSKFLTRISGYLRRLGGSLQEAFVREEAQTDSPMAAADIFGQQDYLSEKTFDAIRDKIIRSRFNKITLRDGTVAVFEDLVINDHPAASAYVAMIARNAVIDLQRKIQSNPQILSLDEPFSPEDIDSEQKQEIAAPQIKYRELSEEEEKTVIQEIADKAGLNTEQARIFQFLYNELLQKGKTPGVKEISRALGIKVTRESLEEIYRKAHKYISQTRSELDALPFIPMGIFSPREAQAYFDAKYNTRIGLKKVLEGIASSSPDSARAELARILLQNVPDAKIESLIDDSADFSGRFYIGQSRIELNYEYLTSTDLFETVVLHEAMHAATADAVNLFLQNKQLPSRVKRSIQELERLRKKLIRKTIKDESIRREYLLLSEQNPQLAREKYPDIPYGLSNLYEFIAESFTNPKFIQFLRDNPIRDFRQKVVSALKRFVEIVLDILGIPRLGVWEKIVNETFTIIQYAREIKNKPRELIQSSLRTILDSPAPDEKNAQQYISSEFVQETLQEAARLVFGDNVSLQRTQEEKNFSFSRQGDKLVIQFNPDKISETVNISSNSEEEAFQTWRNIVTDWLLDSFVFSETDARRNSIYRILSESLRNRESAVIKNFNNENIEHPSWSDEEYGKRLVLWASRKALLSSLPQELRDSLYNSGVMGAVYELAHQMLAVRGNSEYEELLRQKATQLLNAIHINPRFAFRNETFQYVNRLFQETSPIEVLKLRNLLQRKPFQPFRELAEKFLSKLTNAADATEAESLIARYQQQFSQDPSEDSRLKLMVINAISSFYHKSLLQKAQNSNERQKVGELFFRDFDALTQAGLEESNDPMAMVARMTSGSGRILRLWKELIQYDPDLLAVYSLRRLYKSLYRSLSTPGREAVQILAEQLHNQQLAETEIVGELLARLSALEEELIKVHGRISGDSQAQTDEGRLRRRVERFIDASPPTGEKVKAVRLTDIVLESIVKAGGRFDVHIFAKELQRHFNVNEETALFYARRIEQEAQDKIFEIGSRYIRGVLKSTAAKVEDRLGKDFSNMLRSQEVENELLKRFSEGRGITTEDVIGVVAGMLGYNVDAQLLQKYAELHKKLAELPEGGMPAQNIMNEINKIERSITGVWALDVMMSLRKMYLLWGPRTFYLAGIGSLFAASINSILRIGVQLANKKLSIADAGKIIEYMPLILRNSLVRGIAAFRGSQVLKSDIVKQSDLLRSIEEGVKVQSKAFPQLSDSELFQFLFRLQARFAGYAGKVLAFLDKTITSVAHDLYVLTDDKTQDGLSPREFWQKYFNPPPELRQKLEEKVENELRSQMIRPWQREARYLELLESVLPDDMLVRARNFGAIAAFVESENSIKEVWEDGVIVTRRSNKNMNGVLGYLGDIVMRAKKSQYPVIAKTADFLAPFVPTPINLLNWSMNFTPWGYIRSLNPDGIYKLTPEQVQMVRAQSLMGSLTLFTLLLLALSQDEDEVPFFTITGNLKSVSDPRRRKELIGLGLEPYVIKIGKFLVRYQDIFPALAFIGNIVDEYRYGKKDDAALNRAALSLIAGLMNGMTIFVDLSMLQSFGAILSNTNNPSFDPEREVNNFVRAMTRNALSFVTPQIVKDIEAWIYSTTEYGAVKAYREKDIIKYALTQIPFVRHWLGDKPVLNLLGEKIIDPRLPWERVVTTMEKDEVLDFYAQYIQKGGRIPIPNANIRLLGEELTEDALYILQRNTLQNMAKTFRNMNLREISKKPLEYQKQIVDLVYSQSLEVAKVQAAEVQGKTKKQ
jgi:hypothetical protein